MRHSALHSPSTSLLPEALLHVCFPHRLVLVVHEPDGDIIKPRLGVLSALLILCIPPLPRLSFIILYWKRLHIQPGLCAHRVASAGRACHIARQRSAGHNFDSYRAVVRDENGLLHARVFILSIELKRRQGEHGTISLGWADSGERAFPSSHCIRPSLPLIPSSIPAATCGMLIASISDFPANPGVHHLRDRRECRTQAGQRVAHLPERPYSQQPDTLRARHRDGGGDNGPVHDCALDDHAA